MEHPIKRLLLLCCQEKIDVGQSWDLNGYRLQNSRFYSQNQQSSQTFCLTASAQLNTQKYGMFCSLKGLSPSAKQHRNSCSGQSAVYQDLSKGHDWPVKKAIVNLPIRLKGNSKHTSGNSLSPLGTLNMDFGAVSQTLLTGVRLHLPSWLGNTKIERDLTTFLRVSSQLLSDPTANPTQGVGVGKEGGERKWAPPLPPDSRAFFANKPTAKHRSFTIIKESQ